MKCLICKEEFTGKDPKDDICPNCDATREELSDNKGE